MKGSEMESTTEVEVRPYALRTLRDEAADAHVPIHARGHHVVLRIQWDVRDEPVYACGDSYCTGGCNLPAVVIQVNDHLELRMHGVAVATGNVMQGWRVPWGGARLQAPEPYHAYLLKAIWV